MNRLSCAGLLAVSLFTLACKSDNTQSANAQIKANGKDTTINFSNSPAKQLPAGWSAETGVWQIDTDSANPALKMTRNENTDFNVAVFKSAYYQNIEIEAKAKAVSGEEDQGGGLVWRFVDSRNYYIVRFNPLENNIRLYKVVNGTRKQMQSENAQIKSGNWFTIKVKASGDKIECYLDGEKVLSDTDDTFESPGLVGFWSKADAVSIFDDLKIDVLK